jgi:biopolymer transport protein ExbD
MDIRPKRKVLMDGGMSSMTDLVFLILIFFVVLSTMASTGHNIELPKSGEGDPGSNKIAKVYVTKDNQYFIGEDSTEPIAPEDLEAQMLLNVGVDSTFELLGDKESDLQFTIVALDIIKKHGLKVIIKTKS